MGEQRLGPPKLEDAERIVELENCVAELKEEIRKKDQEIAGLNRFIDLIERNLFLQKFREE